MRNRTRKHRGAFTLVELMVAMTLIMFIMVILTEAFKAGLDAFRNLRSAGNMAEQLRTATITMRKDLTADHFGGEFKSGYAGPKLSQQRLDLLGWSPPKEGFVRILMSDNTTDFFNEGTDGDGVPSFRATKDVLHFTAKLSGHSPDQLFVANLKNANIDWNAVNTAPSGQPKTPQSVQATNSIYGTPSNKLFISPWAEVAYFLKANAGSTANGTQLHTLCRRQRVLAPGSASVYVDAAGLTETSVGGFTVSAGVQRLRNSADVINVANRMFNGSTAPTVTGEGDDTLLTNVISLEVRPFWGAPSETLITGDTGTVASSTDANKLVRLNNPTTSPERIEFPFLRLPRKDTNIASYTIDNGTLGSVLPATHTSVFDTWFASAPTLSTATGPTDRPDWFDTTDSFKQQTTGGTPDKSLFNPPLRIWVKALQIRIRVWDAKTEKVRQVTFIQQM
jgi:type II secretory pathway pseudopilin PulG